MKIFEVGTKKTGTTSLGDALQGLGFKRKGWTYNLSNQFEASNYTNHDILWDTIDNHDVFEDRPWHDIDVKLLDTRYPGSKFILLERDDESWLRSVENWENPLINVAQIPENYTDKRWLGDKEILKQTLLKEKHAKYRYVKRYFKNRPNDLLVMSIKDGWEPLCEFLNIPIPSIPFPKSNTAAQHIKENKRNRRKD